MTPPTRSSRRLAHLRTILLSGAARVYLRIAFGTARIETLGQSLADLTAVAPPPYIGVFWHARLLWPAWAFRGPRFAVMVSDHADGALIRRVVGGFGTRAVTGSSLRGGAEALRSACRLIEEGVSFAIAPDGPLGPSERAKPGAIALASLTGAPLVPVAFAARPRLAFSSWDRMIVPLPGSRVVVALGDPIAVAPSLDAAATEAARARLEAALLELTRACDRRLDERSAPLLS